MDDPADSRHSPEATWVGDELSANLFDDMATIRGIEAAPSILRVIHDMTGMGFVAIARVTESRWIACSILDRIDFGLRPGGELKVETTICHEIRRSREGVVIDHVAEDEEYRGHPTPAMYGFQSYISMPIVRRDGTIFGTLCAIDPKPHRLRDSGVVGMFRLFAELIATHIDSTDRLASSEASLMDEREAAELREQFIAVLGHDLRNPLAAIDAGTHLLSRTPLNEKAAGILEAMRGSVARMAGLIDDVLDLARGRLGGGFKLTRNAEQPLRPVLEQVIAELRAAWPDRRVDAAFAIEEPVDCDRDRLAQLCSNLVGNALKHGSAAAPARVQALTADGVFQLSVANAGDPIPAVALKRLFQPFTRGADKGDAQGLGLGLYIASEIARAHGGMLTVASTPEETRFTFQMPLR